MINGINDMGLFINSLSGFGNSNGESRSNIFETVMISLLSAISEKNKTVTNPEDKVSIEDIIGSLNSCKLNGININNNSFSKNINLDDINISNLSKKIE